MSKRFPLWRLRDGEEQEAADLLPSRLLAFNALGAVLGAVLLLGGAIGVGLTADNAESLLADGKPVQGTVVEVGPPQNEGLAMMKVRYPASDGREHTAQVAVPRSDYFAGQEITVVYDPDDPERIRTGRATNQSGSPEAAFVLMIVFALLWLPFRLVGVARWSSRRSALTNAGWRPGTAVTSGFGPRSRAFVEVEFDSGDSETYGVLWMVNKPSLPPELANKSELEVWVGGEGNALVVYFEDDRSLFAVKPTE